MVGKWELGLNLKSKYTLTQNPRNIIQGWTKEKTKKMKEEGPKRVKPKMDQNCKIN